MSAKLVSPKNWIKPAYKKLCHVFCPISSPLFDIFYIAMLLFSSTQISALWRTIVVVLFLGVVTLLWTQRPLYPLSSLTDWAKPTENPSISNQDSATLTTSSSISVSGTVEQFPGESPAGKVSKVQGERENCSTLAGADDIFIILKAGSNDIYQKLPIHLLTLLKCAPHYAVFSDLEHYVGLQRIRDAIAPISSKVKESREEFAYYRKIQRSFEDGEDLAALEEDAVGDDRDGWNLDKWKWLPMIRTVFNEHPNMKWYFIIEPDTAVLWNNLLLWIQQLNSTDLIYSGSQNSLGDLAFAHGGSGVLISNAAMKQLMAEYPSHVDQWESETAENCCGDVMLAKQFRDAGVQLTASFPITQGEAPLTIDWNGRHMCAPIVTWHHVSSMDIDMLWELQQNWTDKHVSKVGF
jgi:hypothetical protein